MNEKELLGKEYKAKRKMLGLTQVELSKILDMSQSRLSKIEHGQLVPAAIEDRKFLEMKKGKL